jgi:hypothetical protein
VGANVFSRALKHILKKNRQVHGNQPNERINEVQCTFQNKVDEELQREA